MRYSVSGKGIVTRERCSSSEARLRVERWDNTYLIAQVLSFAVAGVGGSGKAFKVHQ